MAEVPGASPAGLYIHVPFCRSKCPYCDFYSVTDPSRIAAYVHALRREMTIHRRFAPRFDTLYLGGGTPSILPPAALARIIETAQQSFSLDPDAEITLEANPGTVSLHGLAAVRDIGINRINIGVQSFRDDRLRFLGRIHTAREARAAVDAARRAGFDNIGIDLIHGLPGETARDWVAELSAAVEPAPDHLSAYLLTCEPDTPLDRARRAGRFSPIGDRRAARLLQLTHNWLDAAGYPGYEISNFARSETAQSRHNRKYWTDVAYLGLGPAAHSFRGTLRRWNIRDLDRYLAALDRGRAPVAGAERLTVIQRMIESVYLGLRMRKGWDPKSFTARFGPEPLERMAPRIDRLIEEGMARWESGRLILTGRGLPVHEPIAAHLCGAFEDGRVRR